MSLPVPSALEPCEPDEAASVHGLLRALLQKHTALEDSIRRIEQLLDPGQPGKAVPVKETIDMQFTDCQRKVTHRTTVASPRDLSRELSSLEKEEYKLISRATRLLRPLRLWNPSSLLTYSTLERIVAFAILLNAVTIGVEIDLQLRGHSDAVASDVLQVVNWGCVILFVVELAARVWMDGCEFFAWSNADLGWNLFDFATVVSSALELVLQKLLSKSNWLQLSFLRVLRILRFVKAVRVIRVLPVFRELRVMIAGVLKCSKSLLWAFFLMVLTTYVYAILVGHTCVTRPAGMEELDGGVQSCDFGSIVELMYILFQCTTGGLSWGVFSDSLIPVSPILVVAFCGYMGEEFDLRPMGTR